MGTEEQINQQLAVMFDHSLSYRDRKDYQLQVLQLIDLLLTLHPGKRAVAEWSVISPGDSVWVSAQFRSFLEERQTPIITVGDSAKLRLFYSWLYQKNYLRQASLDYLRCNSLPICI
jgi:hypothetical protein